MSTFQSITNEHAVVLQEIPGCANLLDYVKAVASAIGSSHIHSIVKSDNKIKLYLKEKKYVDYVIGAGIVLRGHHASAEYVNPPAAHILVLNIDPMVPDDRVLALLSPFGIFKSNVIRPTLSEDSTYCHILSGERRVYMKLFDHVQIPETLSVEYEGAEYDVALKVEVPRISEVRSNVACVNPVREGHRTSAAEKNLPGEHELHFKEREVKVEVESGNESENDDDLFELFSEVNDWDQLLSNDCGQEDQPKAREKLSTKSNANVCSVKPMPSSRSGRNVP